MLRQPPPKRLVEGGRFQFGVFDGPIENVNPLDAQPFDVPLPRAARSLRLKEWEAFQIVDDRFFAVLALFDARLMALAQLKVYDRRSRKKHVFERKLAPWAIHIGQGVLDSDTWHEGRGCTMRFTNRLREGRLDIGLDVAATRDFPGLKAELVARTEGHDALVVAIPFGPNRGMVSHKGPLAVTGDVRLGDERMEVTPATTQLLVDDHKGYYPWVMQWDWVTGAGRDAEGRRVVFNLTRNQSIDPARFHENCLWIDGRAHMLSPVTFERTGCVKGDRWRIRDTDGRVDVGFTIEVEGRVDVNALIVRSDYEGPFGTFEGTVSAEDGVTARVDGLFGMGERFWLRC